MKNLIDRIFIYESLLKQNEIEPFLKLIMGDELITYDNNVQKRSKWSKQGEVPQTVVKRGLTPRKMMICVWWDRKGIVHYDLLPSGQRIDFNLYCQQLERLRQAIKRKWPELFNKKGVVFYHDNARPHTSLVTCQKLRKPDWEVFWGIHLIVLILHQTIICFDFYRTFLMM